MPRLKQISSTITNPDTAVSGAEAWTNPANVRDSGDPPVVDGTNGTFASAAIDLTHVARAMRFHSPAAVAGLLWVGLTIDWSATGDAGCSCVLRVVNRSGNLIQLKGGLPGTTSILKGGDARRQNTFSLVDVNDARWPYRGDEDLQVTAQASLGSGVSATFNIYEIGYLYASRLETGRLEG